MPWRENSWPDQVIILHMPRQLSCRNICKIVTWLTYQRHTDSNIIFTRFRLWAHKPLTGQTFWKMWIKLHTLVITLQWRHNEHDSVSNHQPHDCLHKHLIRDRSKKTSKLRVTGLCAENSPVTGEFPAQRASNTENVSIWWRHHDSAVIYYIVYTCLFIFGMFCIWWRVFEIHPFHRSHNV